MGPPLTAEDIWRASLSQNRADPAFWGGRRWQVMLGGRWSDFSDQEDSAMKSAYVAGRTWVLTQARGQKYRVDFDTMRQKNMSTEPYKERAIRHLAVNGKPPYWEFMLEIRFNSMTTVFGSAEIFSKN